MAGMGLGERADQLQPTDEPGHDEPGQACKQREANKKIVRHVLEEVIGAGRTDLTAQVIADSLVTRGPDFPKGLRGPDGLCLWVAHLRETFPDLQVEVVDQLAEGDKVATRFVVRATHSYSYLGIPASGRTLSTTGIVIHRLESGKIAEAWLELDMVRLLGQLGLVPPSLADGVW